MKNWYIIQSHSSFENKVAALIKEEAEKAKISEKIDQIMLNIPNLPDKNVPIGEDENSNIEKNENAIR